MQAGDRFIRYSKDGGVTRGVVARSWSKYSLDLKNGVVIKKRLIISDRGIVFDVNECYLVDRDLSLNFIKKLKALFSKKARNTSPDQAQ